MARIMGSLTIGRGTEEGVEVGPLIDDDQLAKVEELVDDAVARGARCCVAGRRSTDPATSTSRRCSPTSRRTRACCARRSSAPSPRCARSATEEQALAEANDTEFGLVAYLYTTDLARALRMSERLETGMVGLNQGLVSNAGAPFGGIKQSGFGREGGPEGIEEYLETKYVAIAAP